jgi:4-amino-4-deoxy-L-arabinose transferase-like glycosyltransferase
MIRLLRSPAAWIALLACLLALAGLGLRGIWDPDEGRYTNVALNMLDSGDWINPHRNHEVGHWTKPPLTYWAIASSLGVLGHTPFAARLPSALAYLLVVGLAWRTARRLAPGGERIAALAYATMLLPFAASQLITTDPFLAACQGLAMHGFVEARFGDRPRPRRWLTLMWAAFGLAFLTKGPPALLPLLAILAFDLLRGDRARYRVFDFAGLLVFALLALPWYLAVIHGNPGLLQYFIGDEVYNRIATDEFGRHGEWYGWLKVYLPTLLLGSLPWTLVLLRWARGLPARLHRWRSREARAREPAALLLTLWVLLPLLVFCLARSRLPLYLLPLFLPLSLLVARQWVADRRRLPHWGWIAAWAGLLLGLKLVAAGMDSSKDAAAWAREIRARVPGEIYEVNAIDDLPRYGLRLELGVEVERLSLAPVGDAPRFNPSFDHALASELAEGEPDVVWHTPVERLPEVRARVEALGYRIETLGAPYRDRAIFRIVPATPRQPP